MSQEQLWRVIDGEGSECGPFTADQLAGYAADGTILPATLVWTDGHDTWMPASQVEGLFPAGVRRPQLLTGAATPAGGPPGTSRPVAFGRAPAIKVSQPRSGATALIVLGIVTPLLLLGAYFALRGSAPEAVAAQESSETVPESEVAPQGEPSPRTTERPEHGGGLEIVAPPELVPATVEVALTAAQWESIAAIEENGGFFKDPTLSGLLVMGSLTTEYIAHLKRLDMLRVLHLHRCAIEKDAPAHLKELSSVEVLDLEGVDLDDDWLVHVTEMPNLKTLRINGVPVADAHLAHLKDMPKLRELELRATETTDSGMEHLGPLSGLEGLALQGEFTDEGLRHLGGLTGLKTLHLWSDQITDSGLEHLTGLTKLETLNLELEVIKYRPFDVTGLLDETPEEVVEKMNNRYYRVTDSGLVHLQKLVGLKQLFLGKIRATDEGVKNLRKAMAGCEITMGSAWSQSIFVPSERRMMGSVMDSPTAPRLESPRRSPVR